MNYDYRPVRQNYVAHMTVLMLFVLSGVTFGMSGFLPPHAVLWQILGLLLLLPAIHLIARYMATRYLYRLHTDEQGHTQLEIFLYRGGDRMQMVCCTALDEITAACPLSAENLRAKKGVKRYNYAQDLRPQRALVLSLSNADGTCEVLFCPDEYITRVIGEAVGGGTEKVATK